MAKEQHRVVFYGSCACGQTKIIRRLSSGVYNEQHVQTVNLDLRIVNRVVDGVLIKLVAFDIPWMPSQWRSDFHTLKEADAIVITHSLTNPELNEVCDLARQVKSAAPEAKLVLLGSKADLVEERRVSLQQMLATALKIGATYVEVSALSCQGIEDAAEEVVRVMRSK